jgi:hypothetical protein
LRFSCPNLLNEAYTEAKLNQQLAAVAKVLSTIKTPSQQIKLKYLKYLIGLKVISRLKGLSLILNQYSAVKISAAKTNYKEYNWNLNE